MAVAEALGSIARGVGLACLLEHGAPARAADRERQGLSVRLLMSGRGRRVPARHAAGDRRTAGSLDEHRIGVFDTNLAPFGLRMRDDEAAARRVAERFCEVARPYLAG